MEEPKNPTYKRILASSSNYIFITLGLIFCLVSLLIIFFSIWDLVVCLLNQCDRLNALLDFVGYLIIAVAIFDVGRYLLEEEVFRERELRSPGEARRSLTKFMVIIVIAVTLESLLNVLKAGAVDLESLVYPAILFLVAVLLLVGLGVYQRLSSLTEQEVMKGSSAED